MEESPLAQKQVTRQETDFRVIKTIMFFLVTIFCEGDTPSIFFRVQLRNGGSQTASWVTNLPLDVRTRVALAWKTSCEQTTSGWSAAPGSVPREGNRILSIQHNTSIKVVPEKGNSQKCTKQAQTEEKSHGAGFYNSPSNQAMSMGEGYCSLSAPCNFTQAKHRSCAAILILCAAQVALPHRLFQRCGVQVCQKLRWTKRPKTLHANIGTLCCKRDGAFLTLSCS